MSCLYSTAIDTKLQDLFTQNPQNLLQNPNSIREFICDAKKFLNLLPARFIGTVNYVLYLDIVHPQLYPTQTRIGRRADASRITAHRHLSRAHRIGIVLKEFRGVKKTCLYKISEILKIPKVRKALSYLFPALKYLRKQYHLINSNMLAHPKVVRSGKEGGDTQIISPSYFTKPANANTAGYKLTSDSKRKSVSEKKREVMSEAKPLEQINFRPKVLQLGKMTHATLSGLFMLEEFTDQDIDHGIARLSKQARIEKPFNWVMIPLKESYYKRENAQPIFKRSHYMAQEAGHKISFPYAVEGKPWIGSMEQQPKKRQQQGEQDTHYVPGSQKGDVHAYYAGQEKLNQSSKKPSDPQYDCPREEYRKYESKLRDPANSVLVGYMGNRNIFEREVRESIFEEITGIDLKTVKHGKAELMKPYAQEIEQRFALFKESIETEFEASEPETTGSASLRLTESAVNPAVFTDSSSGSNEMHFRKLGISGLDTALSANNLNQQVNLSDPAHAVSLPESPVSVSLVGHSQSGTRSGSQTTQDSTAVNRDFQLVNPLSFLDGLATGGRRDPAYGSNSNKNQRRLFEDSG